MMDKLEEFDIDKFREAIWEMYMLETLYRARGNPIEADRLLNTRIKLKKSVGIDTTFKDEETKSDD